MKTIELMKIMSSSVKAKIILRLLKCKCVKPTVNELCEDFHLKQPNISKHFMDLREKGVVIFEKRGKEIFYTLDPNFKKDNGKILLAILERAEKEEITTSHCNE